MYRIKYKIGKEYFSPEYHGYHHNFDLITLEDGMRVILTDKDFGYVGIARKTGSQYLHEPDLKAIRIDGLEEYLFELITSKLSVINVDGNECFGGENFRPVIFKDDVEKYRLKIGQQIIGAEGLDAWSGVVSYCEVYSERILGIPITDFKSLVVPERRRWFLEVDKADLYHY